MHTDSRIEDSEKWQRKLPTARERERAGIHLVHYVSVAVVFIIDCVTAARVVADFHMHSLHCKLSHCSIIIIIIRLSVSVLCSCYCFLICDISILFSHG